MDVSGYFMPITLAEELHGAKLTSSPLLLGLWRALCYLCFCIKRLHDYLGDGSQASWFGTASRAQALVLANSSVRLSTV